MLKGPNDPETTSCKLTRLRCRRTGRWTSLAEHARCPYCFGTEKDLARGRYQGFCDFKPERDPVHFGFPPDARREELG
jgi:hypothetical protein